MVKDLLNRITLKKLDIVSAKKSRYLTNNEKALARSVFSDDIDLTKVQLKSAWWVLKNYAVSPNGNIYFNLHDWSEDFTKESLAKQSWLIHELTHVWQLQQGIKVVRKAVFDRRYAYKVLKDKSFFDYGVEQQAKMVQDYFLRREKGYNCLAWQKCIPFLNPEDELIVFNFNEAYRQKFDKANPEYKYKA